MVLFGASQLPKLARAIGASAREFRKGVQQGEEEKEDEAEGKGKQD